MGQVKSMIPEGVLRHKSPDRRNRVFKTYFDLNRKSKRLAFSWWFFLWPIAGHRLYLNQYKSAAVVVVLLLPSLIFLMMQELSGADSSGTEFDLFIFFPFIIFLVEGLLLTPSVGFANKKIRDRLGDEIEAVPYVPLSQ
jgi:hypothetical protein